MTRLTQVLLTMYLVNVVAGTPAGSPSAPATPANSISLATIAVAAGATTIVTANITDTRTRTDIDELYFHQAQQAPYLFVFNLTLVKQETHYRL
jgi:hypothetical protein